MIDVTFQLIIFFILAGQMASAALAQLRLHRPWESQALQEEKVGTSSNRVIVNVLSKGPKEEGEDNPYLSGRVDCYQVGTRKIDLMEVESRLLALFRQRQAKAKADGHKEFFVEIRADRRVNFSFVEPVMLTAAQAGIPKMNITALLNVAD